MRALTGIDPDRLPEEKARGITIDLGFAHVDLGDGIVASFVDVPGHERFVRNMLAGVHGMGAVVLVVAADESVMPQTREHFEICRLLGVPRGLVALTKCDAADADAQAVAAAEVTELVSGSFLEGAPVLRVSSRTGLGLDELRAALAALAHATPQRAPGGPFRLPIDRVFTMKGFGTVVTGTLVAGSLAVADEVEVLPSGRRARVRGLHVHGESQPRAEGGTRTAVNLAGIETHELERGEMLAAPGSLRATSMLDVELQLLPKAGPLEDGTRLRIHVASAERLGRVRLLDPGPLQPGRSALAQLRLEGPVATGRLDRLVVRSYSPATTIGGAVVLDPLPPRRRAKDRERVARLRDAPSLASAAQALVEEAGSAGIEAHIAAARLTASAEELEAALAGIPTIVAVGPSSRLLVAREALGRLGQAALDALGAYHRANPLRAAMPREELRARACPGSRATLFDRVVDELAAAGQVRAQAKAVALATHDVRLDSREQRARDGLLAATARAGLAGIEIAPLAQESGIEPALLSRLARMLVTENRLVCIGGAVFVNTEAIDTLKTTVRLRWSSGTRLDVGAFKEMTGLTRKHAIPLLEFLDRERVTRRVGADRFVM